MADESNQIVVVEKVVLHKYSSDLTEEQINSGEFEPEETLVLNDKGEVIEHQKGEL